jgi:hydroxyethylthiazole kinase-like uncharacterized protein yjeF
MTELLTATQMRALEQAAIASGQVTGLELMERAGRGVVEAIFDEWPELKATSHRAVVLCGPGNNGGDGFVVARLLKEWGWEVEVFLYGTPEKMPPDARANYERWVGMWEVRAVGDPLSNEFDYDDFMEATYRISETSILIDAFFGIGFQGNLENLEPILAATGMYRAYPDLMPARCVSVDLPSGLNAQTGKANPANTVPDGLFQCVRAALTVTFHRPKLGHFLNIGPEVSGNLRVVDIGLRAPIKEAIPLVWPKAGLEKLAGHKYSHGHALIVSGDHGRAGAARLAARGALRIGAGVVTVASPPPAMAENAARLDAIMLREVADGDALAGVLEDKRINALCLGPGMGTGARQAGVLAAALLSRAEARPTGGDVGRALARLVLDADALTLLSQHPELFAALHPDCILTPHAGEFARLFPDIAGKLNAPATRGPAYSKVDATREAAARAGCVVLFKGPDTVIADASGQCAINSAHYDRAAPWLATAGSGDVLAGFITGLLARGFSPFDAACTGAWLHVECARSFGPGLIAEDLPEELPKVFRALGM